MNNSSCSRRCGYVENHWKPPPVAKLDVKRQALGGTPERILCRLWKKRGEKKGLPGPGKGIFYPVQILDWERIASQIWGSKTEQLSEFSTIRAAYPQFLGSYPHFGFVTVCTQHHIWCPTVPVRQPDSPALPRRHPGNGPVHPTVCRRNIPPAQACHRLNASGFFGNPYNIFSGDVYTWLIYPAGVPPGKGSG
jgi:hypothetical protein